MYIQSKSSQGPLMNSDNTGVQSKVQHAYKMEQIARNKLDDFASGVKEYDRKISELKNSLGKANDTLKTLADKST